jgi:hypothetical protein
MKNRSIDRKRIADYCVFGILLLLYSGLTFTLFYRQAIEYQGMYVSDMKAYIQETMGLESGYEFPYRFFFWLSRLWLPVATPAAAVAFSTMLLNSAGVIALKCFLGRKLEEYAGKHLVPWSFLWDAAVNFFVFSLFFVSMFYGPRGYAIFGYDYIYRCAGILTANPYWNATYLAVRPFTILCFFWTAELLEVYEAGLPVKKAVLLAAFSFLAAFTKPSFAFVQLPVAGCVLLYRLIASKFRNWKNTLRFGCCFLPAGFLLLSQFFGVFVGENVLGEETGIGIGMGKAWQLHSFNIPLSVMLALLFPFCVLALNFREIKKNTEFRLAWLLLLAGFLEYLFLYEKGFRMAHMNFSWGYMHGLFFVFVVCAMQMLRNLMGWRPWIYKLFVAPEFFLYVCHLCCGIGFFVYLYEGNNMSVF